MNTIDLLKQMEAIAEEIHAAEEKLVELRASAKKPAEEYMNAQTDLSHSASGPLPVKPPPGAGVRNGERPAVSRAAS
jgi:hypothetical protein